MPWKDRVNVLFHLKCCCFVELTKRRGVDEREILEQDDVSDSELTSLASVSSTDDLDTNLESAML